MDDDRQDRENEIFRDELKKGEDRQAERDFLKDRSIGGKDAPRPTDDFIDRSLGKDQNRMEIVAEASEQTDKRMAQEDGKDRHLREHARADRAKSQQAEKSNKSSDEDKEGGGFLSKARRDREKKRDRGR